MMTELPQIATCLDQACAKSDIIGRREVYRIN
jgi:hypothetical protein